MHHKLPDTRVSLLCMFMHTNTLQNAGGFIFNETEQIISTEVYKRTRKKDKNVVRGN